MIEIVTSAIGSIVLCVFIIQLLGSYSEKDNSDPSNGRSGLQIFTDHLTGLQYLRAGFFGNITPRLDEDGNHIRINSKVKNV